MDLLLLAFVLSAFLESNAEAGIVRITNTSHNNIKINIIPEPSSECPSYCWKCLKGAVPSQGYRYEMKEIVIPTNFNKGNSSSFAVVGTDGGFLFNGKCENLTVLKNYEVQFEETTFGLSCKSKEI